jgi:hypothetical protein
LDDAARPARARRVTGSRRANHRFPVYEGACYGRGTGVGLDRATGVALGVADAVDVGVAVAVAVAEGVAVELAVAVGVAVGVGEPDGAQYLPPVLK